MPCLTHPVLLMVLRTPQISVTKDRPSIIIRAGAGERMGCVGGEFYPRSPEGSESGGFGVGRVRSRESENRTRDNPAFIY